MSAPSFRTSVPSLTLPSKHIHQAHRPHIPCAARDAEFCDLMYPTNKDMWRHVRAAHRLFAAHKANGIPEEGGTCPVCGKFINRDDNLTRHIAKQHGKKG